MKLLSQLPAPLANRAPNGELTLGIVADDIVNTPTLSAIVLALRRQAPLPVRLYVFHDAAATGTNPAPQPAAADIPAPCESLSLQSERAPALLAQLEALLLSEHALPQLRSTCAALRLPALIVLAAETNDWQGEGLALAHAKPEETAALLLVLATDPPTRRQTLKAQQAWLTEPASSTWRVEGVFDSSYSLAIVNRRLAYALEDSGVPLALYTYEQGDTPQPNFAAIEQPERAQAMWARSHDPLPPAVALRNAWPPVVRDMRAGLRVLANYAWEETGFPAEYAADFNRVLDLITVVSRQTAQILQDAGVNVPIAVVGNGIDHLLESPPEPLPVRLPEGFRFLHISSCFPRKGVDVLLQAYGQAFRADDPVVLIIKTFPNPHNDVAEQLTRHRRADPNYPKVYLEQDDWRPGQIAALYQACDALVLPSRGEGFGLPAAEAMLHQRPVIATAWGGHRDFCTPDTAWLIDYQLTPAQTHLSQPGSLWAEPDPDHLARLLQEVYTASPAEKAARCQAANALVRQTYSWAAVARRTREAIERITTMPAPLRWPRVGWLSTWGSRCGIAAYSSHLTAAIPPEQLKIYAPETEIPEFVDPPFVIRNWQHGAQQLDRVATALKQDAIDALVIQHHWGFFSPQALAELIEAACALDVQIYLEFHNTRSAPESARTPEMLALYARCARLIVHGVDDANRLKSWGLTDNLWRLPLAVYPVPRPSADQLTALRAKLPAHQTLLLTYGYLMPHKGLLQMLEALPKLLTTHPHTHWLMLNAWYNDQASKAEFERIQARVAELGLAAHITFETRFLPEAESLAWLSLADLVVFPYQNTEESSSAAVRMAIAAERPIAVTPLPIFADVAEAVTPLPGIHPDEIAAGLASQLNALRDPTHRAQTVARAAAYANAHHAHALSSRLWGCIQGLAYYLAPRARQIS